MTNFNISLVENFNQTGAGVLCLKDAVKAALEEGLKAGNISGGTDGLDGKKASLQVIQISHSGSSLYNVSYPFHSLLPFTCAEKISGRCANWMAVHGYRVQQGR